MVVYGRCPKTDLGGLNSLYQQLSREQKKIVQPRFSRVSGFHSKSRTPSAFSRVTAHPSAETVPRQSLVPFPHVSLSRNYCFNHMQGALLKAVKLHSNNSSSNDNHQKQQQAKPKASNSKQQQPTTTTTHNNRQQTTNNRLTTNNRQRQQSKQKQEERAEQEGQEQREEHKAQEEQEEQGEREEQGDREEADKQVLQSQRMPLKQPQTNRKFSFHSTQTN